MAKTIDLNAHRAAKAEQRGDETQTVVVGDDRYELAPELPIEVIALFAEAAGGDPLKLLAALKGILGESADELITKHRLTVDELRLILDGYLDGFGISLGESSASPS